jgi:uncharacterized protein YqhQ
MPEFSANPEKMIIGGQAVIEGVMMRSKRYMTVAVRRPDKTIALQTKRLKKVPFSLFSKPFFRGVYTLIDSLVIGLKALTYSANESSEEGEELSDREMVFTLLFAGLVSIGLFVALPFVLGKWLTKTTFWFNVIDGILRMAIFFTYILVISRMEDIRRVFQYHGAEHKTVHAYEAGVPLTVKNVKKFSVLHPRCGTTFMLIVVVTSIVIFSFLLSEQWYVQFFGRLLLLPVVAGISYEILRVSAAHYKNAVCKLLIGPGLMLQKLTTREPDDDQIAVAIRSLSTVLAKEKKS